MAETQAKSGMGTSIDPSDPEAVADAESSAAASAVMDGAAVGRAVVHGDGGPAGGVESKIATYDPAIPYEPSNAAQVDRRTGPVVASPPASMVGRGTAPARRPGTRTSADGTSARVADAVRSARATVATAAARGPRRARLFVKRIDPWSVMKFSFAVSFVLFFVLVVATAVLYLALDQMNVFSDINRAISQLFAGKTNIKITATTVIGAAGAVGLVMVVLFTALSTLGAFIYNVCADLVGGIEITLSEKE